MLFKKMNWLALLGGALLVTVAPAFAQDSGPLIDLLVKKGIVTEAPDAPESDNEGQDQ